MHAYLYLRDSDRIRKAVATGLAKIGYEVVEGLSSTPAHCDILVTWNLPAPVRAVSRLYSKIIVTENSTWGNDFVGDRWLHVALSQHNTADRFPIGGHERWDDLGVSLKPFRSSGETLILAQRGIGPPGIASPDRWAEDARDRYGGRIRRHPGVKTLNVEPLDQDLQSVGRVVTWSSGAAVKALMLGVPVVSEMPGWIGEQDNTEQGRLAMFRRLAWAQWRLSEIASGEPFERLLR